MSGAERPSRGADPATRLLHLLARVALRVRPPLQAKRCVDAAAHLAPRLAVDAARAQLAAMADARAGSCLSRAIAIASRLDRAEVVIGVATAPGSRPSDASAESGARAPRGAAAPTPSRRDFRAHAWIEIGGQPLLDASVDRDRQGTHEMTRLA